MKYSCCDYTSEKRIICTELNVSNEILEQQLVIQEDEQVKIELCITKIQ